MSVRIERERELGAPAVAIHQQGDEWLQIPSRVVVHVDDGSLPVDLRFVMRTDLDTGAVPVCEEFTARQRPGGPSYSDEVAKTIRLRTLMREAVNLVARPTAPIYDDDGEHIGWDFPPRRPIQSVDRQVIFDEPVKPRSNAVAPAVKREAAELHDDAKRQGKSDPYTWVAEQMNTSRATAARWAREWRKENGQ